MSQLTSNTTPFIHAQQYSSFILATLKDGLLPTAFYRNVSDFGEGSTLNIKTIGTATVQEVEENTPLIYNPIETGNIQLAITDYVGDAWFVTDDLKEDGSQIEQLMSMRGMEATRTIQEHFETRFLATLYAGLTAADPNTINGQQHLRVASGSNDTLDLTDIINMRLAFDKANVPVGGRIGIVDPVVAATMAEQFTGTFATDHNPAFQAVLEEGFDREHRFVMNLFGFDIWTSNRLPRTAAGAGDGTATVTGTGVANIFMSVLDDQTKPGMMAWRRQPRTEGERNKDRQRDEFLVTSRWGMGVQRIDTLGVILTDDAAIA